ncbi:MAG: RNA polymerase sigma factor [Kofleriaceae bacterium]|nr:RNA polymerase sigma factor [Kofleriaceae bacterium]
MTERNRLQVLRAAAAGDDVALSALVRAYHDRVYRFGIRVCRDPYDADDAVQEAFTKLARRPDVARDPGVLSWLMTVVKNACLRLMRPFARERRSLGERIADTDAAELPAAGGDPQHALERWRLVHAVHDAIAALDPASREVIVMRDLEGLTGDEACVALGLSEAAMKSRLHRARGELRKLLLQRGWSN